MKEIDPGLGTFKSDQTDVYNKLNQSLCGGVIYALPNNTFGVLIEGGRVISFTEKGASDVTEFAVPVTRTETRTQKGVLGAGTLFLFDDGLYQTISDKGSTITAFHFATKSVVTISPERLSMRGDIRAIGVVYRPEANAFNGDMFHALKTIAAASNDRQTLYDLRRKEALWAQRHNQPEPPSDGLDEVMVFANNPGMTTFQTFLQSQAQTQAISALAEAMTKLVEKLGGGEKPAPADAPDAPDENTSDIDK